MAKAKSVFLSSFFEQKRTIEALLEESKASPSFYLFLSASAFITTLGFLLGSTIIVIGGMFVAPLLFPILSLGMGITTSSRNAIFRALEVLVKSVILVSLVAFVTAFILNGREVNELMLFASSPNLLFFLTAFVSGIVAAYAWAKEDISSTLPSIAVTVSLIPPLTLVGIALSLFSRDIFAGSLSLFILNVLGVVLASTLVFSLFGFSALQQIEERKIREERLEKIKEEK